jgi:hypothetical protein
MGEIMNITPKEANALIHLLELDICTDVAETSWEDTTCGIHDLTKGQAFVLRDKLSKIPQLQEALEYVRSNH